MPYLSVNHIILSEPLEASATTSEPQAVGQSQQSQPVPVVSHSDNEDERDDDGDGIVVDAAIAEEVSALRGDDAEPLQPREVAQAAEDVEMVEATREVVKVDCTPEPMPPANGTSSTMTQDVSMEDAADSATIERTLDQVHSSPPASNGPSAMVTA